MTTELLESPTQNVVAEKQTHGELMREVHGVLGRKANKQYKTIFAYSNIVEVVEYKTGYEKTVYRTGSINDAKAWCDKNNFGYLVCDIRHLGKKWT